ncbi:MAG: hypothetical protein IJZ72_04890 [Oscillospiraceae bacterium]|nr:hypothetical protein [Oscillospiraceae bacterium]
MRGNMIKKKSERGKLSGLFDYLVLLSAVVVSGTPLNTLYYTETVVFYFIITFMYFCRKKIHTNFTMQKKTTVCLLLIIVLMFTTAIINFDADIAYYFGIMLLFISSFFIIETMNYNVFCSRFIKLFVVISVYSVIFTIVLNLFNQVVNIMPLIYVNGNVNASWRTWGFIYNVWDIYARFSLIRNSACFREPGVFGCFVSIAVILKLIQIKNNSTKKKNDIFELIVLVIAVLSTFSTTAYISIFFILLLFVLNNKQEKKHIIAFLLLTIIISILLYNFSDLLFDKFDKNNTSFSSLYDRIAGMDQSITCWLNSPAFGVGMTKYFETVTEGVNAISFLYVLGEFGLIMLLIFLHMFLCWIQQTNFAFISKVILFAEIVLILNTQNIIFMPLIILIMFYGIKHNSNESDSNHVQVQEQ